MNRPSHYLTALVLLGITAGVARAKTPDTQPSVLPKTATARADAPPASPDIDLTPSPEDSPELMLFKDIPVVVAAGKREQTEHEAPASVSIITANDIELSGYQSLADALRNQRSFFLHTDGLNWFLGVRGFQRPADH